MTDAFRFFFSQPRDLGLWGLRNNAEANKKKRDNHRVKQNTGAIAKQFRKATISDDMKEYFKGKEKQRKQNRVRNEQPKGEIN
jgi:alpha-amylase/alpha-mannosidase (GH57 family)